MNLIVATSAGILAAGIANLFTLDNYIHYGLFGFFSTWFVYNSQRLFKSNSKTRTPWLKWVDKHRLTINILSIIGGLLAGYFFILLLNEITLTIVALVSGAGFISFFYVVRVGEKNIREIPYLKIHSVALTWTAMMVVFPIVNENIHNWRILMFFTPANYLYFIAVAIPFDIRDMKYDSPKQRTIPQVVGVRNAKLIAVILLGLALAGIGSISNTFMLKPMTVFAILIQILLITFLPEKHQNFYCSVLIDGAIALLGISYFVL